MRVRALIDSDIPALRRILEETGYSFEFPNLADPNVGNFVVVVDDEDKPIMGACTKLVPEVTLICPRGSGPHPLVKLKALAFIHQALRNLLVAEGHDEAHIFIPPEIEGNYGRHLQRKFGWVPTWKCFRIRDWMKG